MYVSTVCMLYHMRPMKICTVIIIMPQWAEPWRRAYTVLWFWIQQGVDIILFSRHVVLVKNIYIMQHYSLAYYFDQANNFTFRLGVQLRYTKNSHNNKIVEAII